IPHQTVKRQRHFLEHGSAHLKPMTMVQIADAVGVHETTVSRAISGKYMSTPQGVFEMKYFFTPGYRTATGESMSNTSVKEALLDLVKSEHGNLPLRDSSTPLETTKNGIAAPDGRSFGERYERRPSSLHHCRMAWSSRKKISSGPLAGDCRVASEADATARPEGTSARNGSHRCLEQDCRRFYRRSFIASPLARRHSLCPCAPAGLALRTRAGLEDRYPAKVETALRRKSNPRRSLSRRLKTSDSSAVLLYKAKYLLLKLQHGSGRVVSNSQFQRA